jgi:putative ABC transport system permease protein
MIGIFIGITAVVSLLSLGQGLQESINEQFKSLGSNRLTVAPGGQFLGPGTSDLVSPILDDSDLGVIRSTRGVDQAHGVVARALKIEVDDVVDFKNIFSFDTDSDAQRFVAGLGLFTIGEGRDLKSGDRFKAVVGYNVAYESFEDDIELGEKILVNDIEFEVVGIQELIGTGIHDAVIRIPQDRMRELIDEPDKYSLFFVQTREGFDPADVGEILTRNLRSHRDVKEDEEDFNVQTGEQTVDQLNTILLALQVVIIGIAAISLLVGGLGIMNAMYTSVLERTKEIGIMKSIGARNWHISFLFLVESGFLGLAGGLVGLILGLSIAKIGELFAISLGASFFRMHISATLIIGTLLFSLFFGMGSGLFPARQAAALNPVDALRSVK